MSFISNKKLFCDVCVYTLKKAREIIERFNLLNLSVKIIHLYETCLIDSKKSLVNIPHQTCSCIKIAGLWTRVHVSINASYTKNLRAKELKFASWSISDFFYIHSRIYLPLQHCAHMINRLRA